MGRVSRRHFLKQTLFTGAALAVAPMIFVPKARAVWEKKSAVHPNVNNLRVVGITDKKMIRSNEPVTSWARQEKLVIPEVVGESLDKLACALAEARNPEEAWRTIFVKPARKP